METTPEGVKFASFNPKLGFEEIVKGSRVISFDDLYTTGGSLARVNELIRKSGGEVVASAVVVRRSQNVTADDCGAPVLEVLAEANFIDYPADECPLCVARVPVVLRPGHGHEWIKSHKGYPIAS